jgi:hypothetical protein
MDRLQKFICRSKKYTANKWGLINIGIINIGIIGIWNYATNTKIYNWTTRQQSSQLARLLYTILFVDQAPETESI